MNIASNIAQMALLQALLLLLLDGYYKRCYCLIAPTALRRVMFPRFGLQDDWDLILPDKQFVRK